MVRWMGAFFLLCMHACTDRACERGMCGDGPTRVGAMSVLYCVDQRGAYTAATYSKTAPRAHPTKPGRS